MLEQHRKVTVLDMMLENLGRLMLAIAENEEELLYCQEIVFRAERDIRKMTGMNDKTTLETLKRIHKKYLERVITLEEKREKDLKQAESLKQAIKKKMKGEIDD